MSARHGVPLDDRTRYGGDPAALARVAALLAAGEPDTFPPAARDALLGADGTVRVALEATVELESNRYPVAIRTPGGFVWGDTVDPTGPAAPGTAPALLPWAALGVPGLTDARRSASFRLAVADSTLADVRARAADVDTDDAAVPYAATVATVPTVAAADLPDDGAGGVTGWRTYPADLSGAGTVPPRFADTGAPRLGVALLGGIGWTAPARQPSGMHYPAAREVTVVAFYRLAAGASGVVRVGLEVADAAGGALVLPGPTVPIVGNATSYTRVAATFRVPPGALRWSLARPLLGVVSATDAVAITCPLLYAGPDRGGTVGADAHAVPGGGAGVPLLYLDPFDPAAPATTRRLSRVDVHGDPRLGLPSSVTAYGTTSTSATPPASAWVPLGSAASAGRVSVPVDEQDVTGVLAVVEEVTANGGYVAVTEVDARLVVDLSDRVVSARLSSSREVEPGAAASTAGARQTASLLLEVDNADRSLSPSRVATIDVGHRVETAWRVTYPDPATGADRVVAVPAGVFYTDGWDAPSDTDTATLEAFDLLGFRSSSAVPVELWTDAPAVDVIRDVALTVLDVDDDAVAVTTTASDTLPYAFPTGDAGTYLTDLANAVPAAVYVDRLERLRVVERGLDDPTPVLTVTPDTAVVATRSPTVVGSRRTSVTVEATPFDPDVPPAELLYQRDPGLGALIVPSGVSSRDAQGRTVPGGPITLDLPLDKYPAAYLFVTVIGTNVQVLERRPLADRYRVTIGTVDPLTTGQVDTLEVYGRPLGTRAVTATAQDVAARKRYGDRPLTIRAPLVQTDAKALAVAQAALDVYGATGPDGRRQAPDVTVDALGLVLLDGGDVLTVTDTDGGGGDYRVLAHDLTVDGPAVTSTVVARRDYAGLYGITDRDAADGTAVTSY